MANEKLTAKEILDRTFLDVAIENLERRQRELIQRRQEIIADINEAREIAAYNNSVRLNWDDENDEDGEDYEDYEDSEDSEDE